MQTLLYETNDKTIRAYSILSDKQNLNSYIISFNLRLEYLCLLPKIHMKLNVTMKDEKRSTRNTCYTNYLKEYYYNTDTHPPNMGLLLSTLCLH